MQIFRYFNIRQQKIHGETELNFFYFLIIYVFFFKKLLTLFIYNAVHIAQTCTNDEEGYDFSGHVARTGPRQPLAAKSKTYSEIAFTPALLLFAYLLHNHSTTGANNRPTHLLKHERDFLKRTKDLFSKGPSLHANEPLDRKQNLYVYIKTPMKFVC